jgi:hypothetical protein
MGNDTYFFTYCLIFGTFLGFFWRLFVKGAARETFYRQLSALALEVFLPIHIAGTLLKIGASSKIEFALVFIVGGMVCCIAILAVARVSFAVFAGGRALLPHYPYIASTFAGGGRAVVLLAAASPFVDTMLADLVDPRLHGRGGMLDALAIFDAGYWAFFTLVVYEFFMRRSYPNGRADSFDSFSASRPFVVVVGLVFIVEVFQEPIVNAVGVGAIDLARLFLAAVISIFASAAVSLVAKSTSALSSARGIGLILLVRFVALALVALAAYVAMPAYLSLLWLPMAVMLLAPPSSFIPQMLYFRGASEAQRDEAVALNLSWNMALYVFIAGLVAASLATAYP